MAQMFRDILFNRRRFQPGIHQPISILDSICKRRMLQSVRFKIRSNRSTRFRISNIKRATSNRVIYNHKIISNNCKVISNQSVELKPNHNR